MTHVVSTHDVFPTVTSLPMTDLLRHPPGSACQAWELYDLPFADMTADGAQSHASRRRDILTAMAEAEVNLARGAARGTPTTPATTAMASPPSPCTPGPGSPGPGSPAPGSPAEDAAPAAATPCCSSHHPQMTAFLSAPDTLLLSNIGIGEDSSDGEGEDPTA